MRTWPCSRLVGGTAIGSLDATSPAPRPELLERAAERGFRFVAHRSGCSCHRLAFEQQARRELHPPQREVLHRRLANHLREAIRKHRTRDTGRSRQRLDRPRRRGLAVKGGQRLSDDGIPEPGEPAGLGWRQRLDVAANRLDEHELRHPRQDVVAARTRGSRLAHGDVQQRGEPPARRLVARS